MKTGLLEETYELIKSLSKTEKRYFKLYTKFQQGDKSYLKLFDIIEKQAVYNERTINQKFLEKNKVTNFPAVKKYLFDQLVASIKSYGAYKDLDSDHTDLIETYKVLEYKGLHGQSDRLLKKVKQLTLEDDAFNRHFSVLLLEYNKEIHNTDNTGPANAVRILQELRNTLSIMDNYSTVGEISVRIRLHLRKKAYCRNEKDKAELTKIIAPLLKTTEEAMLSRTALSIRKLALCDYYLAVGQPHEAFETSKIYLKLRKNAGSNDKLDILTLYEYGVHMKICVSSGCFENFEEEMKKYKLLLDTVRNKPKYYEVYEGWHNNFLIFYNRTGQFERGAAFLKKSPCQNTDIEKRFSMRGKVCLWYVTAYNMFALKEYKAALDCAQKIINAANDEICEFSFAKLLIMFIHYELKNYELLEYQVRSARRSMERTERLYACEKLVLEFFNLVSGTDNRSQRQQLLNLQKLVKALFTNPREKAFSSYFDIQSWIESKLIGKDFANTVRSAYLGTSTINT